MNMIDVLNFNENCVCINIAPNRSILLDEARYGSPSVTPLTFTEIKYANNNTAFKTGTLEFPEEIEDEVYKELRIDKDKVIKLNEIRDILLHPTKDGLQRILSISTLSDFDRVRGQFFKMKNEGYKLTLDLADIIERRTKELFENKTKTRIIIDDNDVSLPNETRVHELEEKLAAMEALLKQTLELQKATTSTAVKEETKEEKPVAKKKPGRPANTKKSS